MSSHVSSLTYLAHVVTCMHPLQVEQEMARRFSLSEESLLAFEVQDLDIEQYMQEPAAVQNAVQCYRVVSDENKGAMTQTSLGHFYQEG